MTKALQEIGLYHIRLPHTFYADKPYLQPFCGFQDHGRSVPPSPPPYAFGFGWQATLWPGARRRLGVGVSSGEAEKSSAKFRVFPGMARSGSFHLAQLIDTTANP